MSARQGARKALVLSPSASHPQDYGNRNRVFQTTSWLKDAGFAVHFVLYPYESDWVNGVPQSAADMRAAWESFTVIPPSLTLHAPPQGEYHEIDEWWDPQIGQWLEWLFAREAFDVFVVNYTFFSKAFEFAPANVVKVLETHDIFSGRKELFQAHGAAPEFFYTTPEQERLALDRADIIVAIKDAEAEHLRALTSRDVVSVPFDVVERPVARRPARLETTEPLKVGFIGALNTVNALNMARFLDRFARCERIYVPPPIEIRIAGNVCSKLRATSPSVKLLGHVPSVEEYYQDIDVVVAPMSFSTGIKIKVGEALSFGKAVVATQNGFDGFPSTDEFHSLESVDAVCRAVIKLAFDRERLQVLENRSEVSARLARRRSAAGYGALARTIGRLSKAVVFITDQALWRADTIAQERLAQWAEYCSHRARVVIVYTGEEQIASFARGNRRLARNSSIVCATDGVDAVLRTLADLSQSFTLLDVVISAGRGTGTAIWDGLRGTFDTITLDTWVPELARIAGGTPGDHRDIWLRRTSSSAAEAGRSISATALRYLPESLRAWAGTPLSNDILAVLCDADAADLHGLAVLDAIAGPGRVVIDEQLAGLSSDGSDWLRTLGERARPRVYLAIGNNMRSVETCRSIAACAEIPFLHLSSDRFPLAFVAAEGEIELCHSYGDVALLLNELQGHEQKGASEHPRDTGWSAYWRHLSHVG
jgi:glycosyltransferase involved in cell wall biosynthesis